MRGISLFLLASIALSACGAPGSSMRTSPQPASPDDRELVAIARARADSARLLHTEADVEFMSGMIGHHAQAIAMARLAPTHGAGAALRTLAGRIINAQQGEIRIMQQWLRDRNLAVPEVSPDGHVMMQGMAHDHLMPGMLTDEQMRQLDAARGTDFDRLFVSLMIQHHEGAIAMVRELLGSYGAGRDDTVFKLASDINVDQETEIRRMQQMLAELLFGGSAP